MEHAPEKQIRVLHVDDDPDITDLTGTFLERENDRISVETAHSTKEGLERINRQPPDCIVSDYNMPGKDGIEFLKELRENHPKLPFILFTGKGSEAVASEAISAGVTDYLQKETGSEQYELLANRIENVVDSRRNERRVKFLQTLEKELTELSIEFLRAEDRDIDTLIDRTLERIGTTVNADRTYVFSIDHEAETLTNTNEWCSEDVEPQIDMLQDLPQDTFSWWTQKLKDSEKITVPDVSELPPEAEAEQESLQDQNVESLIVTPMVSNDELVGFIGFDWVSKQEVYSDELTDVLRMVSELITTARKRREREKELREVTERLNLAVEGANLGVWDWDLQTDSVTFNEQWAQMLGLSVEEIEPTLDAWEKRVHPEDIEEVNAALDDHIGGKTEYYDTEHRMQTASGHWKWIRDIGRVVERDDDGEPTRAVGIHLDIDEQKQRRQELKEYETIVESLNDAVYVIDEEGRFTYINDGFVELVGYDRETIIGNTPSLIKDEGDVEQAEKQLGRLLSSDGPESAVFEVTIHTCEGDPVVCEDHMGVLPYEGEQFNGSVGVLRDITEYKKRRQRLKRQKDRLEEFASVVSHDLRNPLQVAHGRLRLVQEDCESEHIDDIEQALDRMDALIEDVLTLAQEGNEVGEAEPVVLADVVKDCWQNVSTTEAEIVTDYDRTIRADRTRLQQLLENLLGNAIEHGGEDVTVSVGTTEDGFYVADTGPGIPEGNREEVFEAGYSTNEGGTGFGLRIVNQVAEAHGWEVTVTESDQGGARFEFSDVEFVDC